MFLSYYLVEVYPRPCRSRSGGHRASSWLRLAHESAQGPGRAGVVLRVRGIHGLHVGPASLVTGGGGTGDHDGLHGSLGLELNVVAGSSLS